MRYDLVRNVLKRARRSRMARPQTVSPAVVVQIQISLVAVDVGLSHHLLHLVVRKEEAEHVVHSIAVARPRSWAPARLHNPLSAVPW